ncbi:CsiV family protein [Alteromonas gracilis]|uniref:CsiV family protein n=1 Tax=Alteromonas gracilis TaxID=1479524 RepID=UPI00321B6CAF
MTLFGKLKKLTTAYRVPASLPIIIEGHDWPRASHAHLLSSEQQSLNSISRQIRSNRDLERLFHATWRQPVAFGKDNAFNVRLYGGRNYSDEYELSGEQRPRAQKMTLSELQNISAIDNLFSGALNLDSTTSASLTGANEAQTGVQAQQAELNDSSQDNQGQNANTERPSLVSAPDIFTKLEQKLSTPAPISFEAFKALDLPEMFDDNDNASVSNALRTPIWEIDGTMKVFLKYINRVPYLHIDSALFYRQPVPLSYFSNSDIDAINQTIALNSADNDNGAATEVEYRLASVPLAEQRRVISTQLHYFDHPLFGFIVQIRRYQRPALEETEQ